MQLTIIISYYKAQDNLKLILEALKHQSQTDFEVIISEDDNNPKTNDFVASSSHLYPFSIQHIYQNEDLGFRKNSMLNRAIVLAKSEKLVFIDGDCVPHKSFVKQYVNKMQLGFFYAGRSVMLSQSISERIVKNCSVKDLHLLSLVQSRSGIIKEGIYLPTLTFFRKDRGLLGRNWGVLKQHLLDINGFDEDYQKAGVGEDTDIEWRLQKSGVKRKSIKNAAIIYHIYHPRGYSEEGVKFNYDLMYEKQAKNEVVCLNGIKK